jgi:hypothetical protein
MALFSSRKIFSSRDQIKKKLFEIKSLDYQQRPKVYEALIAQMDDGGVTEQELKLVLRELRQDLEISETDREHLLGLLSKK